MTCPTCGGSGHRPDAPWLLCPEECEAVVVIRGRSGDGETTARRSVLPKVITDPSVPPGEVHMYSGGRVVRMLGVEP